MDKIIKIFAPQSCFWAETDIKWAPGSGKQVGEGGRAGDRDSRLGSLPWAEASEEESQSLEK